ncbi:hypothetical protein FVE85_4854 [Porphyridium purpureum]|uniref:Uncharacterized protein n=1 Tax=Porphyridium purpureum TaxID=35688 RepID=A0A5J4YTD2_PORPP|nr:hypothetical protein FVE85_4854 [Porphyridium purpureum]|eukprot:POR2525..scf236_6
MAPPPPRPRPPSRVTPRQALPGMPRQTMVWPDEPQLRASAPAGAQPAGVALDVNAHSHAREWHARGAGVVQHQQQQQQNVPLAVALQVPPFAYHPRAHVMMQTMPSRGDAASVQHMLQVQQLQAQQQLLLDQIHALQWQQRQQQLQQGHHHEVATTNAPPVGPGSQQSECGGAHVHARAQQNERKDVPRSASVTLHTRQAKNGAAHRIISSNLKRRHVDVSTGRHTASIPRRRRNQKYKAKLKNRVALGHKGSADRETHSEVPPASRTSGEEATVLQTREARGLEMMQFLDDAERKQEEQSRGARSSLSQPFEPPREDSDGAQSSCSRLVELPEEDDEGIQSDDMSGPVDLRAGEAGLRLLVEMAFNDKQSLDHPAPKAFIPQVADSDVESGEIPLYTSIGFHTVDFNSDAGAHSECGSQQSGYL